MNKKIVIVCDSHEGGIFDYAKLVYEKIKKSEKAEFYYLKAKKYKFYKNLIKKLILSNSSTVIDLHCLIWPVAMLSVLIKKMRGFELIFEAHDEPFSKKLKYRPFFIRKFIMKSSDMIVAHSRYCLNQCRKISGMPKINYIPFGPLLDSVPIGKNNARKKLGITERNVALFFGIIQPNKGLDVLLKALPKVISKESSFRLMIVGPSKENFKKYEEIIHKLHLEKNLSKFIKYVPVSKSGVFFSASDFVVLPYREITQSAVPFVSYLYRRPVIASRTGGFLEIIKNKKTGILFESENSDELAECMISYINNKSLCENNGKNGHKLITTGEYSWKNITRKYKELFDIHERKN